MKSILILLLITFVFPTTQIKPDLEKTINKDFKILNLSPSSFHSNKKGRITHRSVITEIKNNFIIDSDISIPTTKNEYTEDEIQITEWEISNHGKYKRIIQRESEVYIKKTLYKFTYYLIELKEPSINLKYFTEENYGLISYSINDKTIDIKRNSKSQRLRDEYEEICKIKKKIENGL